MAETENGYKRANLIRDSAREGRPWKTVEDVQLATFSRVHRDILIRLHGYLNDAPPAEFEGTLYATKQATHSLVAIQESEPPSNAG